MAICAPTAFTRAVTLESDEQLSTAHTRKVRRSPRLGGPAAPEATALRTGALRPGTVGARGAYSRVWATRRRNRSNSRATEPATVCCPPVAAGLASSAVTAAAPDGEAPHSRNGAESPETPAADWGTTRYSTESVADPLLGSSTHPEFWLGSTDT